MQNPLLFDGPHPDIQAVEPAHLEDAITTLLATYTQELEAVKQVSEPTWDTIFARLELIGTKFDKAWNVISHLIAVNNSTDLRVAYEALLPQVTDFFTQVGQDTVLWQQVAALAASAEFNQLNFAQQMVIKHSLRDFKLAGVDLSAAIKQQFSEISQQISQLSNKFSNNVLDSTNAFEYKVALADIDKMQGITEDSLQVASAKAKEKGYEGFIFGLDFPTYHAVITNCANREVRAEFYRAYTTRASDLFSASAEFDNSQIIEEILQLKQKMASLVGYANYAEYSLATKMAKNAQEVIDFLGEISAKAKSFAQEEVAQIAEFARELDGITELAPWDLAYYSEAYKRRFFEIDEEQIKSYFQEPKVVAGMFAIVEQLYKIKIKEVTSELQNTLWHPSVRAYQIIEQDNVIGLFYTDLYTRDTKRGGAWMADCLQRVRFRDGTLQYPTGFLCCNFAPATKGAPGLLYHGDVVTLFHEFGHMLHHLLSKIEYSEVSGINGVPWDGVELPSQFFENWAWDFEVLTNISEHVVTKAPISKELFTKLHATKNYNAGLFIMRQMEFALFDIQLHANLPENKGLTAQQILNKVRQDVAVISVPDFVRFQNSFTHIFAGGYDAGYYSYMWADVLSCDAFNFFKQQGLFNQELGLKFKQNILEFGGARDFMESYVAFAGRAPQLSALFESYGLQVT